MFWVKGWRPPKFLFGWRLYNVDCRLMWLEERDTKDIYPYKSRWPVNILQLMWGTGT